MTHPMAITIPATILRRKEAEAALLSPAISQSRASIYSRMAVSPGLLTSIITREGSGLAAPAAS